MYYSQLGSDLELYIQVRVEGSCTSVYIRCFASLYIQMLAEMVLTVLCLP